MPIRTAITLPSLSREKAGRREGMPGAVVREEMVFTKRPAFVAPRPFVGPRRQIVSESLITEPCHFRKPLDFK
jgi:hypothetical protein